MALAGHRRVADIRRAQNRLDAAALAVRRRGIQCLRAPKDHLRRRLGALGRLAGAMDRL